MTIFAFFRRFLPKNKAQDVTQKASEPGPERIEKLIKAMHISAEAVAKIRLTSEPAHPTFNSAFELPSIAPGVVPAGEKLALDEYLGQAYEWARAGNFQEGIGFLGYPYLAELSQRPEYRQITEIIAQEMTRRWIRFTSKGDDDKSKKIQEIEREFNRLDVQNKIRHVLELDVFFGRGHIYIDTGDTDTPDELKLPLGDTSNELSKAKVTKKHPLKELIVVEPMWTYPSAYNSINPLKNNYYKPDSWYVMATTVHQSRLLTFIGHPVPDLLKAAYSFGGLSLSQIAKPYVDNWLRTRQSVSDLLHSFSVMVLKTDMSTILNGGAADMMIARAEVFNKFRDNRNIMMIDKDREDFMNVSASLAGLDHLQAQAQEHMSSVTGIPLIKLLGITPSGLNASSEGEFESFNATIEARQESQMRPHVTKIFNLVQLSLYGEIDPSLGFKFEPLGVMNASAQANVRKVEADTDAILINAGVIAPQESRERIATDEDSKYASIDVNKEITPPDADMSDEEGPGEYEPHTEGLHSNGTSN